MICVSEKLPLVPTVILLLSINVLSHLNVEKEKKEKLLANNYDVVAHQNIVKCFFLLLFSYGDMLRMCFVFTVIILRCFFALLFVVAF